MVVGLTVSSSLWNPHLLRISRVSRRLMGAEASFIQTNVNHWRLAPHSTQRRSFHGATPLQLNRILLDLSELDSPVNNGVPTATLPREDYRTVHVAKILRLQNGSVLRAGIVRDPNNDNNDTDEKEPTEPKGKRGRPRAMVPLKWSDDDYDRTKQWQRQKWSGTVTDTATVEWLPEGKNKRPQPTKNGDPPGSLRIILNDLSESTNHHHRPPVTLLLALPRPLQLGRLLPMISQWGVESLILSSAAKVPREYFGSHLFRKPHKLRESLLEGLCQAGTDVTLPRMYWIRHNLMRFLQNGDEVKGDETEQDTTLDQLFPLHEYARVVAHPDRAVAREQDNPVATTSALRMRQVTFPSDPRKMLLAIGPEGGWDDDMELPRFHSCHFQQVTLGSRVLRSDVAVVSLLSLAHDVCADDGISARE